MLDELRDKRILLVGLGVSGLATARFLAARGIAFDVADSRRQPRGIEELRQIVPGVGLALGGFDAEHFAGYQLLIKSPGLDPAEPAIMAALDAGAELIGDIELFARAVRAPVIAVTGSNGKSTVVSMLGEMAHGAGLCVAVAGNIGHSALDALDSDASLYVLELSSFQLETTHSLAPLAASVLNICEDHLDRYRDLGHYALTKHRIYHRASHWVVNADDPLTLPDDDSIDSAAEHRVSSFGERGEYSLLPGDGGEWLSADGELLMPLAELRVPGRHNGYNALAALALGDAAGLPRVATLAGLRQFSGLKHRCQWLGERDGVACYDDSKGTNVGATLAALKGLAGAAHGASPRHAKVVLIAGGEGKEQDFTPLREVLAETARALVLIGRDADLIDAAVGHVVPTRRAADMGEAVERAVALAVPGDAVLLSPACASFDMFDDYTARGRAFAAAVGRWL